MSSNVASETFEVLSVVPYFAGLDTAILETIAQAAVRRDYDTSQIVFLEGEVCAGLYIVQRGWLKAVKLSPDGREQILRFLGPGETFSEISVLAAAPNNPVTVIALEPSSVLIVPREMMLQLLDEHVGLARIIIQNLAGRIMHLVSLVEDLSLRSVEARLARVLLENASEGVLHRRRWATQSEMAARLGTVPDVLNRVLRGLVERGLIQIERREIRILDPQGLEAKARLDN
jgi:CRP/FNR family transcriptional regulator